MKENDFELLKRYYPRQLAELRCKVEDVCDRLEYEGSPMFSEIPDCVTVHRLADGICRSTDNGISGELVEVMLLNEMYFRRNRYHNRRCER